MGIAYHNTVAVKFLMSVFRLSSYLHASPRGWCHAACSTHHLGSQTSFAQSAPHAFPCKIGFLLLGIADTTTAAVKILMFVFWNASYLLACPKEWCHAACSTHHQGSQTSFAQSAPHAFPCKIGFLLVGIADHNTAAVKFLIFVCRYASYLHASPK